MKINILIKMIRKEKNITLQELSIKSGISSTHINDIENNIKSPSLYAMIRISMALNVKITGLYKVKW